MTSNNKNITPLNQSEDGSHDIEIDLNAMVNNAGDPIFIKDKDCKFILANDALCRLLGLSRREIIGSTLAEKLTPDEIKHFLSIDQQVLETGKEILCEEPLTPNGLKAKTILTRKNRFIDSKGRCFIIGVIHDISERKKIELREKSRTHVLALIASGEMLSVILEAIVRAVEQENPAMLGSILLLDDTGKQLLSGAASSLPDFYNEAVHGLKIGLGVGSCGTAAFINERVIVDDIHTHPYWVPYRDLAKKAGLGACWSEPIRSTTGKVLGTFAIYHHSVNYPTEADLLVIEQTASLASIAIEKNQADSILKSSESRLRLAITVSKQVWFDLNILTGVALSSRESPQLSDHDTVSFHGSLQQWQESLHPDDHDSVLTAYQACLIEGVTFSMDYRRYKKDGTLLWINSNAEIIEWSSPQQPSRMIGVHTDITERKQNDKKLKRAASVFTHAHEGIMITDASGTITEVNDAFSRINGYSALDVLGKNPRILQSGRHSSDFFDEMWATITAQGQWRGELWNRRKNGEIYAEMLTISAVKNTAGCVDHYVSLGTDITKMKEYQGQLERIAHYDVLTKLPNRVLLADRLSQAMLQCERRKRSLAVAFMDLDSFKAVNDTHGHNVGDDLLVALSKRMKEALREGDTLARIGGDEFIAIMVDLENVEDSDLLLERLLKAASEPITVGDIVIQVSASIGVTFYPNDGVDADQLMRHADQAMYVAKQAGKNRYQLFDVTQENAIPIKLKNIGDIP
jgi:diguanylate cyclase (GGDEF)-like protein/PAS domain S-box-containing protein